MQQLPEHFLQFVWENKYFQLFDLRTNKGLPITIVNIGKKNYGAGADFWNATIYIGDVQLEGDVEIHVRASDWRRHKHQFDKNYNNVILHVVYEDDEVAYNKLGNAVDCLYFAPLINSDVLNKYAHLSKQSTFIPCQSHIMEHLKLLEEMWLPKLAWERIQRKAEKISRQFEEQTSDYEKIFYQLICRSITNYTNEYPMDILSKIVPFKLVQLYSHSVFMLESLFFGQAEDRKSVV